MKTLLFTMLAVLSALTLVLSLAAGADVEKGKAVYGQYCGGCHGATGKGDGPAAASLNPKPRDHTDKAMKSLTDQYLTDIIAKGGAAVGKSALMPPWGAALKDDQVRDVVAYIRSLAK